MILLTKEQQNELELAERYMEDFCSLNDLKMPELVLVDSNQLKVGEVCEGFYHDYSDTIFAVPEYCDYYSKKYYSPYYRYDHSLLGTIIHEFGHYVHCKKLKFVDFKGFRSFPINSYAEMSSREDFAETFRLFVLNPDYLFYFDSERYNRLIELGLKFKERISWEELFKKYNVNEDVYFSVKRDLSRGGANSFLVA